MRLKNLLLLLLFILCLFLVAVTQSQGGDTIQKLYRDLNNAVSEGRYEQLPAIEKAVDAELKNEKALSLKERALAYALAGSVKVELSKSDEALPLLIKALPLCEAAFGKTADETLEAKKYLSSAYGYTNNLEMERRYSYELLDHYRKTDKDKYAIRIADLNNTIGYSYGWDGDRIAEQNALDQGKALMEAYRPTNDSLKQAAQKNLSNIYNSLSISYMATQDVSSALSYARKSLALRQVYAPETMERAINWMIIGRCFELAENNLDSSLFYMDKAIGLFEEREMTGHPAWATYKSYKADILIKAGRVDEAITEVQSALRLAEKAGTLSPQVAGSLAKNYNALARTYTEKGEYGKALSAYESAKAVIKKAGGVTPIIDAVPNANYATALGLIKQWDKAEQVFDSAVAKTGRIMAQLKDPADSLSLATPLEFLEVYRQAGNHLVNRGLAEKRNPTFLAGIGILQKVARELQRRRIWYYEAGIDEGIGMQDQTIYEDWLKALHEAKGIMPEGERLSAAFAAIEMSKAGLLRNRLFDEKNLALLLPDTVNRKRLDLKATVYRLMEKAEKSGDVSVNERLIDAKEAYLNFLRDIRKKNSIEERKDKAAAKAGDAFLANHKGAIVNYFLGEKHLYAFIHQNGKQAFVQKEVAPDFEKDLAFVRTNCLIKNPSADLLNVAKMNGLLRHWYRWLLNEVDTTGELVVIPHRQLSLISFEMLDAGNGDQPGPVLEVRPVRYELSASLMQGPKETEADESKAFFGGFASSNFDLGAGNAAAETLTDAERDEAVSLPGAGREVKGIQGITGGDVFTHAKPDDFLTRAADYKVLHVAAHAFANRGPRHQCSLLFETDSAGNNLVSDAKIASLKLNAQLAVLSACNTGTGRLHNGEGMLSLGRSFFLAGCPSVVMSLWKANDASTAKIMTAFYRHLREGLSKSEALRNAKLDYLKTQTKPAWRHPYYWAGFVVVGDDSPVRQKSKTAAWMVWTIAGLLGAGLTALGLYLRRRSKNSLA